jgi:uncharacterized protein (DUF2236 family)
MSSQRYDILKRILALDPQKDCQEIVYLVGSYEYPWMMRKALEFALFRTYAVPSIAALLAQTGQFARHGQRRYDDTSLLIAEFVEHGYDSERGRAAIRQMNRLHHRYSISNDDYLYVLSTFIFVPVYWHQQFGWRQPTQHENLANFYFWLEVGRRMGLRDIPPTYEAFEAFHHQYERERFAFTAETRAIADYTIDIFCSWYPRILTPLIREIIYCFMDERLREAFGYPRPHSVLKALAHASLKMAARVIRLLPPRREPFALTKQPNRTYPHGYTIEQMGLHEEASEHLPG